MMRTSIPAFFVISIYLGKSAFYLKRTRLIIFSVILVLCSITPMIEISRHVQSNFIDKNDENRYMSWAIKNESMILPFDQWLWHKLPETSQSLATTDCIFFKYLAKNNNK